MGVRGTFGIVDLLVVSLTVLVLGLLMSCLSSLLFLLVAKIAFLSAMSMASFSLSNRTGTGTDCAKFLSDVCLAFSEAFKKAF